MIHIGIMSSLRMRPISNPNQPSAGRLLREGGTRHEDQNIIEVRWERVVPHLLVLILGFHHKACREISNVGVQGGSDILGDAEHIWHTVGKFQEDLYSTVSSAVLGLGVRCTKCGVVLTDGIEEAQGAKRRKRTEKAFAVNGMDHRKP